MVRNVHERRLRARPERVGMLLDTLAGPHDRLWPAPPWPPLRLDRGPAVGSTGGHGPIRYSVAAYTPGTVLRFRFAPSSGADGTHAFLVLPDGAGGTLLRHELDVRTSGRMRLAWPVAVRWLHDALLEDLLDRAEREVDGGVARPARWSPWVRLLRAPAGRRPSRAAPRRAVPGGPAGPDRAARTGGVGGSRAEAGSGPGGRRDGGRRPLQLVLGALACIPLASGLAGMLLGPAVLPGDRSRVMASLDSEYRFANAYWAALAPVIWSTLPRVEQDATVLRVALGTTFVGGLARLLAWRTSGRPHPAFVAALALELGGAPALLCWQHHVARAHAGGSGA